MRTRWLSVSLAVAALLAGARSQAEGTSTQGAPGRDATMDNSSRTEGSQSAAGSTYNANQVTGKLRNVDKTGQMVVIGEASGRESRLKLPDNATVFIDGRLGSSDDLKEGQEVRAAFDEKEGSRTLRWIEVTGAPLGGGSAQEPGKQAPATGVGAAGGTMQPQDMQGSMAAQEAPRKPLAANEVEGTVVSLDRKEKNLILGSADQKWTLKFKDDAPVFLDGQRSSLKALQEGQLVRASLDRKRTHAVRIDIVSNPMGAPASKPAPQEPIK